jgi:hypothetical protein
VLLHLAITLCLKVLHRKAKWIKFNGTIIISSETTYGD